VQEIRLEQLTQRLVALETGAGSGQQPAPSGASILTEIYLCDAWSAHEIILGVLRWHACLMMRRARHLPATAPQ
jgi:hypothetical protein